MERRLKPRKRRKQRGNRNRGVTVIGFAAVFAFIAGRAVVMTGGYFFNTAKITDKTQMFQFVNENQDYLKEVVDEMQYLKDDNAGNTDILYRYEKKQREIRNRMC